MLKHDITDPFRLDPLATRNTLKAKGERLCTGVAFSPGFYVPVSAFTGTSVLTALCFLYACSVLPLCRDRSRTAQPGRKLTEGRK
jgi:hypothetical protein